LNRGPADYESAALPTELRRQPEQPAKSTTAQSRRQSSRRSSACSPSACCFSSRRPPRRGAASRSGRASSGARPFGDLLPFCPDLLNPVERLAQHAPDTDRGLVELRLRFASAPGHHVTPDGHLIYSCNPQASWPQSLIALRALFFQCSRGPTPSARAEGSARAAGAYFPQAPAPAFEISNLYSPRRDWNARTSMLNWRGPVG
jgi:hypothetical protein